MVVIRSFGRFYIVVALSWLVVSCAVSDGIGNYVPPEGRLHSLYPYQLKKAPITPIERIQVDSREKGEFAYVCFSGAVTMTFIDGVARMSYEDKKKWPDYGNLTQPIKLELAADGSTDYLLIFSVEAYEHKKRNDSIDVWGETIYQLSWNAEEVREKRFEAELEIRANVFYEKGKPVDIDPVGRGGVTFDCGSFPDEETLRKAMAVFALETLTPEQQLVWDEKK